MDTLPPEVTAAASEALVRSLDRAELKHAFAVISQALLVEVERVDAGLALAERLANRCESWPAEGHTAQL